MGNESKQYEREAKAPQSDPLRPVTNATIDLTKAIEPNVKISIRFKAIGRAPVLKQQIYKISSIDKFQSITIFLRRQLSLKEGEELVRFLQL